MKLMAENTLTAQVMVLSWNNPCNRWPYVRWRPGTKFHEARFRSEPYVLKWSEFFTQGGGWNSQISDGNFTITK